MSQQLHFDENKFDRNVELEHILKILDDSDISYFLGVFLKKSSEIKEQTEIFPLSPEIKISPQDKISKHMKDIKPGNYTQNKKLI